jgi:hypothetical protein
VSTFPWRSTTAQKVAIGQETDAGRNPFESILTGFDHEVPS